MSNLIGIVNYGIAGNIHSIKKAIEKAGGKVLIIDKKEDLKKVDKIVIPGVGSFNDAMKELKKDDLLETLIDEIEKKPTLGICLGMQILSTLGFEYGKTKGLSKIDAEVKPILVDAKVPHMGFNKLNVIKTNKLLSGLENEEFYFMHSYEVVNYTNIVSLTDYVGHNFVSSIQKDNIYGVQFHPEKSREAGIKLFKNFIEL
ncbi:imidazole glycerol phosphate synthase subunit HisH [Aliarcobacter butzleri]|uniref:imidazole glycerol phosphate synthase subunit HisH n=1 Tax=Aliarcobacter butzleri TaxID=28197 RepID=UPI0021B4A0B9|nr:imidazole glycerol phosphate synthase subunit HisH [Aliarcobacter butzleri]MCT7614600.1 imidazole glycerol phosphate synthase subunit HisH [Aliarcobacter butzleri]